MSEWQPIETAPKDGTVVQGEWPGFNPNVPLHTGPMEYRVKWWWPLVCKEYTGWCVPGSGPTAKDPIRWMPLPPPPERL